MTTSELLPQGNYLEVTAGSPCTTHRRHTRRAHPIGPLEFPTWPADPYRERHAPPQVRVSTALGSPARRGTATLAPAATRRSSSAESGRRPGVVRAGHPAAGPGELPRQSWCPSDHRRPRGRPQPVPRVASGLPDRAGRRGRRAEPTRSIRPRHPPWDTAAAVVLADDKRSRAPRTASWLRRLVTRKPPRRRPPNLLRHVAGGRRVDLAEGAAVDGAPGRLWERCGSLVTPVTGARGYLSPFRPEWSMLAPQALGRSGTAGTSHP